MVQMVQRIFVNHPHSSISCCFHAYCFYKFVADLLIFPLFTNDVEEEGLDDI